MPQALITDCQKQYRLETETMANKYSRPVLLLVVSVVFSFLGELYASLVTVATKEGMTNGVMVRIERKLLKRIGQGLEVPHTVEELVASGICAEDECRDAWGRMLEISSEGKGYVRVTSLGDPAIQKLDPDIKFTMSRTIQCQLP